jgi:branched-chain amino acid transport system permease protein
LAIAALPLLVADRYTLKVFTLVGIQAVVVIGLALLFGYAGQISLGHAAFYGIGAYVSAWLVRSAGMPWFVGPLGAVAVATLAGLVLAIPTMRLKGHYLAMATLGFGEIMAVLFVEAKAFTGGPDGMSGIPFPSFGSYVMRGAAENYWLVWAVVGVVLLLSWNLVRSRPGRALRALHASEAAARACGIDVSRSKIAVFALSAGMAGLAGSLYAHFIGFISPSSFGLQASVLFVAMVVLGGMGSLGGAVLGTALLTMLQFPDVLLPGLPRQFSALVTDWQPDIYGLTLILVMLFLPAGLAGLGRSLMRWRKPEGEGT